MANLKVTLELDSQGYVRNIKAADDATKQFKTDAVNGAKEVDRSFDSLTSKSEKLFGAVNKLKTALLGAALISFGRGAIQAADDLQDLSEATDLSVGKILQLQEALQQAGGKAESTSKLITAFYKSVQEARDGSDETQKALDTLGVKFEMLKSATPEEMLRTAAEGLAAITDPAEKTSLALDIFGKSMIGVNPAKFAEALGMTTEEFTKQAESIERAAALNGEFEKSLTRMRLAFLETFGPMISGLSKLLELLAKAPGLISAISIALLAIPGVAVARGLVSAFSFVLKGLDGIRKGAISAKTAVGSVNQALLAQQNTAVAQALRNKASVVGAVALPGAAAVAALSGDRPVDTASRSEADGAVAPRRTYDVKSKEAIKEAKEAARDAIRDAKEAKKELEQQLKAVEGLAGNYRRMADTNISRLGTEKEIVGKAKEEADTIKFTADINRRYAEQIAALEEKKKGAKEPVLKLIDEEIANLQVLKGQEIEAFQITQKRTSEYARQQQEVKNIVDLMEQEAQYAKEIAEFQNQQNQAILTAFELVKAQGEAFKLTAQRAELEKSIQNLRGSEQTTIRELFDLENQRKTQLEAIQKIQNLPFEGVGGMKQKMQEINDLYDARKLKIEETAAKTKEEQDSFAYGWTQAGEKFRNNIKTDAEYAAQQMQTFTKGFEDAIVKFVQTGKLSFKDLANSLIADFARVQAQKMLSGLFSGGGGGGGFLGSIGKIFGFANGGMPPVGKPSLVGERGPELFVPQSAGKIIPNHALGGGSNVVNNTTEVSYNISAVDAQSFKSMLARDPEFIHNVAEQGRRSLPIRSRR
jgi:lambda family phage tail tape measure protein